MVTRAFAMAAMVLAAVGVAAAVPAAEARFTVSPTIINLDSKPGSAAAGAFNVRLAGETGTQFEVEVRDIVQRSDGSTGYGPPSDSPFSASNWVSFSPQKFPGDPKRTQPVEFTLRVPSGAPPGDHVTSLTVTRLPEKSDAVAQPVQAIAVRLTVNVVGKVRRSAEITSLDAPSVSGGSPVEVTATVENTGNVSLDFSDTDTGSLAILQGDERRATTKFDGELFPGQERDFELAWDDPPLFGQFRAAASVDIGKEVVDESKSIVQVPWRQLGALVLIALAVTVLVVGRRRRYG